MKCAMKLRRAMKFETKSRRRAMKMRDVIPVGRPPDETNDVTLRRQLLQAGQANVDPWADISPIRALLEQGCGLEADVARASGCHRTGRQTSTASLLPGTHRHGRGMAGRCKSRDVAGAPIYAESRWRGSRVCQS
jgi:hypothetical protein